MRLNNAFRRLGMTVKPYTWNYMDNHSHITRSFSGSLLLLSTNNPAKCN
jgi:hypothetical protein